jgi:hypothetical protein
MIVPLSPCFSLLLSAVDGELPMEVNSPKVAAVQIKKSSIT